jgi:hypothetical protein
LCTHDGSSRRTVKFHSYIPQFPQQFKWLCLYQA